MVSVATENNPSLPVAVINATLPDDASSCSQSEEGDVECLQASQSDSDLNQGKDSGIDCGPEDSVSLDEETSKAVREMVEFYFSDENILKDPFLLKHVRRNKEGYVSLKLISSFRKVRSLCRNWKSVADSIKKSDLLALNSEETKVRRIAPLPKTENPPSKTLLVYGLPPEKLSIEGISDIFSKCGDIGLVRVLRSGSSVGAEVKQFLSKHPEVQSRGCGLVEFEELAAAKKALALAANESEELRVVPIPPAGESKNDNVEKPSTDEKRSKQGSPKKKKRSKKSNSTAKDDSDGGQKPRRSSSGSLGCSSSSSSPIDNSYLRRHSYNPGSSHLETTSSFASLNNRNRQRGSKDRLTKQKNESETDGDTSGPHSPWRRRTELQSTPQVLAVPVLRAPRGPDGSKGFQSGFRLSPTAE